MTGRVLVTDGNQRSTLALTRSLGKRGIGVTVCNDNLPCLASSSKYCKKALICPSPFNSPDAFVDAMIAETRGTDYDLLIPMTDITSFLIGRNRDALSSYVKIPMPSAESFRLAVDKGNLINLCKELEIPIPRTSIFENIDDILNSASEFSYPVVIKPRCSIYCTPGGVVRTGVRYADSKQELIGAIKSWDRQFSPPLIQERITGIGAGAFLLFKNGQKKAAFFHKRIREKPPSGGVSVLRESMAVHPEMLEYACRVLEHLHWHGVAMAEFKIDESDNIPKLMEINARFWGSLQLAIDSGVDFPHLLYEMATGDKEHFQSDYKSGIRTRWLLGDLDHLLIRLFKRDADLDLPPRHPGRLATLFNFLILYKRNMKYEIIARDDMAPFIFEIRSWMRDLIGRSNDYNVK